MLSAYFGLSVEGIRLPTQLSGPRVCKLSFFKRNEEMERKEEFFKQGWGETFQNLVGQDTWVAQLV